jgi:hypothetical protein
VAGNRDLGRQTADFDSLHPAAAGETLSREDPELAVFHSVVPVSLGVEFDDVDIDFSSSIVRHHEILRSAAREPVFVFLEKAGKGL